MNKIYFILLTFTFSLISYGQSTIVTIDRDNNDDPTLTGNDPLISSSGLTRGSGININPSSSNFTSRDWDGANLADAITNEEYMEWSVSASAINDIEITELDIKMRVNSNGPGNWQILYSLDAFSTAGNTLTTVQTISTTSSIDYNFSGLSVFSGTAGVITFRLYAWNAAAAAGYIRIPKKNAWSDYGISSPGMRLIGNITSSALNSTDSDIIASTDFETNNVTEDIDYTLYDNVASGLTTGNSIKIGEFIIRDGGGSDDGDGLSTILTSLDFDILGNEYLAALAIFDGSTNISEVTVVDPTITFTGLNLIAPSFDTKIFDVYATFNTAVTDNEQIELTISSATSDAITGSGFEFSNAGGAGSPIAGNDNRIEVVRSKLIFGQQPTDVNMFEVITAAPTVLAVDENDNIDLDYTGGSVLIGSVLTLDGSATNTYNTVNGIAVFDNLIFSEQGDDVLIATPLDGFTIGVSDTFSVIGPLIVLAKQDFDGATPEWTYTNDIPFFDNGWDSDGYYGIIDVNIAPPLDYLLFSNNILGENDLYDEGENGTTGFATITFADIDVSTYSNIVVSFDWDVSGYINNDDDARYELFYDGIGQGNVFLVDGNTEIDTDQGSVSVSIPDNVDTISLEISVRNNGHNGYSGFDNFLVSTTFDGLIYLNDTWIPNAPSDLTGLDDVLIYNGSFIVNSNIEANEFIVLSTGSIDVEADSSILVYGNLVSNDNVNLDSNSTEYSSLIVEGNVSGGITYNRHININSGGNDLVSAPVSGETFGDFATNPNNSNLLSNPSNLTQKRFGPFDKTVGLYVSYDTNIPAEAAVTLDPGVGYRSATSDNGNLEFTGIVNTGDINIPIEIAGPGYVQWNLVGNPYPSYILLSSFLAANNSQFDPITSGIYGYDGDASNGWEIWNQAYSDANPNAKITPGQGFLVTSAAASGTISFTPGMRINGDSDDFIAGRSSAPGISHVKLQQSSFNKNYSTDFYFTNNASLGFDPNYDSEIFGGSAPAFSIYSHLVNENVGNDLAIQSLGYDDQNDVTVPLGINVNQGEEVTISISSSTLPMTTYVYLEDNVENTLTLLTEGNYTFTPSSTINNTGRFYLKFTSSVLSADKKFLNNLQIYTTANPKILHINGTLYDNTNLKIFDLQGRQVKSTQLELSTNKNQIDISNLSTGVYVVSLSNNSFIKTKKIIIK